MAEPHPLRTNMNSVSRSARLTVEGIYNTNGATCHESHDLSWGGHPCPPPPPKQHSPSIGNIHFSPLATPRVTTPGKSPMYKRGAGHAKSGGLATYKRGAGHAISGGWAWLSPTRSEPT